MRNKTHLWKRSLAALLSLVMVLGMVPTFGLVPAAYAAEEDDATTEDDSHQEQGPDIEGNYITLPIKIRDYAADGMLFEFNEVGIGKNSSATYTVTKNEADYVVDTVRYNTWYWDLNSTDGSKTTDYDYTGIRVYSADYDVYDETYDQTETTGEYWYCVVLDANGYILTVLDYTANKEDIDTVVDNTTGAAYTVWAWRNSSNVDSYSLLEGITEANKTNYRFVISDIADSDEEDTTAKLSVYLGIPAIVSASDWNLGTTENPDYTGLRVYKYGDLDPASLSAFTAWHCVICDASGAVKRVIPRGREKVEEYTRYMVENGQEGYFTVWAWSDESNTDAYNKISQIRNGNKEEYTLSYQQQSGTAGSLFIDQERYNYYTDITDADGNTVRYYYGDNHAFGLLASSTTDHYNVLNDAAATSGSTDFSDIIYGTQLFSNGSWSDKTEPDAAISYLYSADDRTNYYASQEIYGAKVRTNLVDKGLDTEGHPIYTEETVTFLADFLEVIMPVPWQNEDGSINTYHVEGVKLFKWDDQSKSFSYVATNEGVADESATHDLADVLRYQVNNSAAPDKLGTYEASAQKFADGGLRHYSDVETWFDAAYFLLNNFWRDSFVDMRGTVGQDGYGMPIDRYESLHLVQTTNADGDVCYVFNARYDNTEYDWNEGDIYNTKLNEDFAIAQQWSDEAIDNGDGTYTGGYIDTYAYGNALPVARFDPLGLSGADINQGYGMSGNTYGDMTGHSATQNWGEYYDETNYHLSLEGHAQFVYHQDANQYFTFTGDDDVYLYINGIRVLDIGAAHSISKVKIDLNKVAEICGMVDGGTYSFDFFFLERHGTAANFGIETNIQIAEPSLTTTKTGYQGGSSTGYNGFVDPNVPVAYSFTVKNDGDAAIKNLIFDDREIGIYFSPNEEEIQLYPVGQAEEDHCYSINDMYLYIFNPNGSVKEVYSQGNLTKKIIAEKLEKGLLAGESIGIYGFKYRIPADAWKDETVTVNGEQETHTTFTNTVTTTGTSVSTNKTLRAVADWKVQKTDIPLNQFHVYDWVAQTVSKNPNNDEANRWYSPEGAGVTVTESEIIDILIDNGVIEESQRSDAQIVQCTASGSEVKYNLHPYVVEGVDENGKLTLTYTSRIPGVDQVYFKVKGTEMDSLVFNYRVFTYGAADNTYVLDYGLNVELNGPKFGLMANDHLDVVNSPATAQTIGVSQATKTYDEEKKLNVYTYDPKAKVLKEGVIEGVYGNFNYGEEKTWLDEEAEDAEEVTYLSLMYEPKDIIDNTDAVIAHIEVREEGYDPEQHDLKFYGVDMYELVTTAPASIVYYEENFPGITYVNSDANQWIHYETVDDEGNSVAGTEQSADQNSNYGSDPNYDEDKIGWNEAEASQITFKLDNSDPNVYHQQAVEALNEYLGLADEDSNGTVNKLVVKEKDDVMWFDFVGTGFEIVSRTTNDMYAVLKVSVHLIDDDGNKIINQKGSDQFDDKLPATNADGRVAVIPVITESKGGTVYQVPIISLTGMPKAKYRVTVTAAGNADGNRILYIDGVRIYGPLSNDEALEYYNPEEYQAVIYEVKDLIYNRQAIFADISYTDNDPMLVTGSTLIEDTSDSGYVLTNLNEDGDEVTLADYLSLGPNNEIYMDGNNGSQLIAFYLIPDEDVPVAERTIQIGAHRKADSADGWDDNVGMYYGSTVEALGVENISEQPFYHMVSSGTEQYFDIDVKHLTLREDGRYLVFIVAGATVDDEGQEMDGGLESLALTNLKVKGYDVQFAWQEIEEHGDEEDSETNPMVYTSFAVLRSRMPVEEEPEVETEPVNENLIITSAALRAKTVTSGKTATLSVKATSEAAIIVVTDAAGNVVQSTRSTTKATSTDVTFTFIWKVTGSRGDVQTYTIRVYDANDLASVNTETVSITIK